MLPAEPKKPTRTYTKRMTVVNNLAAWVSIGAAIWMGREMAAAIVPVMVILIASLLGIYQGVGHFDLRATTPEQPEPPALETTDAL